MTNVHSCSYYCDRPECIKAQRDELRDRLAQSEQEPNYWLGYGLQAHTEKPFKGATPLYTAPPQRKPLTDDEINNLKLPPSGTATVRDLVRLIEAAHNIKKQDEMPLFDDWDKDWT